MKIKPKVGDVFLIPLSATSSAGGHVVAIREKEELYVAVFGQKLRKDEVDPEVTIAGDPVLLALTLDAKLFHGHWPIIGNLPIAPNRYPEPAFKVEYGYPGIMSIESRDQSVRRAATFDELKVLRYRSVASPIIIEDAIKAHFGIGEWNESDDEYRAEYAMVSAKLIR
jgi:hypothetical protein